MGMGSEAIHEFQPRMNEWESAIRVFVNSFVDGLPPVEVGKGLSNI